MLRSIGSMTFLALLMVGCGGGDSGSPPPPPATYTVGGTVTGLTGSGLVLTSDFGGDLGVSASGPFTFSTRVPYGQVFNVVVKVQPTSSPAQNCQVANGGQTMPAANVTNVDVTCVSGYTVGGTVSGLVGSGLTLAICHPHFHGCSPVGDPLQIGANGSFTLDLVFPAGYSGDFVTITQQPSSPTQNCLISNAAVSIQSANDTSVTVSCSAFLYVTNAADNTLSTYSIDPTNGALTVIGTPTATGASPHAILGFEDSTSEHKRYIFVGNEESNDVSAFAINNTTGALTAVPGSPFAAGSDPQAMAVQYGSSLYVANAGSDNVFAFNIDGNTGALAASDTYATGKNPTSIIASDGALFVANHGASDISEFGGALVSPLPAGGNPLSLAAGAWGKFLYSANPDATNPSISGFTVDPMTGAVSPLSGSPFSLSVSHYIATDQNGAYLYVTSGASIVGYAIDATTGALTALSGFPVTVGVDAYSITVDPTTGFSTSPTTAPQIFRASDWMPRPAH